MTVSRVRFLVYSTGLIALLATGGLVAAHADNTTPQGTAVLHDATDPSNTIVFAKPGSQTIVTISFNNSVPSTTAPEISVSGADLLASSSMTWVDDNTYTFTFAPSVGVDTIYIDGGVGAAPDSLPQIPLTIVLPVGAQPTATLTTSAGAVVNGPFSATATFSSAVTNFTAGNITVSNGTVDASTFAASPDGTVYNFTVVPSGDGDVVVTLPAGAGLDLSGIPNSASDNALVVNNNTARPHIALSSGVDGTSGTTVHITIQGNSTVVLGDIATSSFVLANASIDSLATSSDGTNSNFTVQATVLAAGTATIQIPGGAVHSLAGNDNIASNIISYTFDQSIPTGTITASSTTSVDGNFFLTIDFDKPVLGFATSTFATDNATITSVFVASSTQVLVSIAASSSGVVLFTLLPNFTDLAGNATTSSSVISLTYTPPTPVVPAVTPVVTGGGSGSATQPADSGSTSGGGSGGGGGGGSFIVPGASGTAAAGGGTTSGSIDGGQVLGASTYHFTKYLFFGSHGIDVTELQKIFISAKLIAIDIPTGYFGALTQAAVRAFQKINSVEETGTVGPITRGVLNSGI
jgi:peptidoglycan hydrolase-like protein with peptidoglycan-binding domain